MTSRRPANPERSFGISVGTVLCLLAAGLFWRGRPFRAEAAAAIGLGLLLCGALRPALLKWPSAWWWRLAQGLGYVNARVLLTLLFVLVIVPLGLIWRLIGKDPLARRRATWPGWVPYPSRYRDSRHFERMY